MVKGTSVLSPFLLMEFFPIQMPTFPLFAYLLALRSPHALTEKE
jgi:hypothetical protein